MTYYPGCSLAGTAAEYDHSIRAVCAALGVTLEEPEDWFCCGASSAHALDDNLAKMLAAQNLVIAGHGGKDLLVPCAACYSRLKFARHAMLKEPGQWATEPLPREMNIVHIHDFLYEEKILDEIVAKIKKPLTGLKTIPYYGCLTVRPPKVLEPENTENPTALDEVLDALGADVLDWSYKTDCCGGSFSLSKPEVVRDLSGKLMERAIETGGDCIVTDCPMCQANLDTRQGEIEQETGKKLNLPILFITELVALAMGIEKTGKWLAKHMVDPRPLLKNRGLL